MSGEDLRRQKPSRETVRKLAALLERRMSKDIRPVDGRDEAQPVQTLNALSGQSSRPSCKHGEESRLFDSPGITSWQKFCQRRGMPCRCGSGLPE